ncbi:MAG: 5'-nucleotidase C-terminal domain-containing protein [Bacteroidales bacterium]|nr:5'-nucleotidase C-terminal domain-containing protein [Bacteroidales bacterium]
MVQTKLILLAATALLACSCQYEYEYSWERHRMDGRRTGVTVPNATNVAQALGTVEGDTYTAPNGKAFPKGSATYAAAADMIGVQGEMARVKEVIGHAPVAMVRHDPESEISNWLVDEMMVDVARLTKRKVDVGITNFGGIRIDMPEGDVILDDLLSMFPFKNYLCYVALKGSDLQAIFDYMAKTRVQVLGGVKLVVDGDKVESVLIGGKRLDPKKTYGVATNDFLLDGGDGLTIGKNAKELIVTDQTIIDAMLPYVRSLTASGKPIAYQTDGRVVIKNREEQQ